MWGLCSQIPYLAQELSWLSPRHSLAGWSWIREIRRRRRRKKRRRSNQGRYGGHYRVAMEGPTPYGRHCPPPRFRKLVKTRMGGIAPCLSKPENAQPTGRTCSANWQGQLAECATPAGGMSSANWQNEFYQLATIPVFRFVWLFV